VGDLACASLEISANHGRDILAERVVRISELAGELRTISLLVVLRNIFDNIEFRVRAHGAADLVLDGTPTARRVAAILDESPRAGLESIGSDLSLFAQDTRRILRRLNPHDLLDYNKVRLGRADDGGYVCIDDFAGIDTAFSFGINDEISWDRDAADRGLTIYQFDHTVGDPAPDDARMRFEAKKIDRVSGADSAALIDLIQTHDKGRTRPNIVLKMDIEGSEWTVLEATPPEYLSRIAWIACELHYFQGLVEPVMRKRIDDGLAAIAESFAAVHVHSNVWGGYSNIANVVVPNVLEVTFANRALYRMRPSSASFPTKLDQSCDLHQPDFYLGAFEF
jgi:hypothetical protein